MGRVKGGSVSKYGLHTKLKTKEEIEKMSKLENIDTKENNLEQNHT